ncbi:thioredoxin family protein [Chloroflexota bacterium]
MRIVRYIFLLGVMLSLFWLLAGCQSEISPETTVGEPAVELDADILARTHTILLDAEGWLIANASLASPDGAVILSIDKGTRLLDKDNNPLSSIWIKTEQEQFVPPQDAHIIGVVYNLGPQDAFFDRPLKLTLSYNPEEIPEGVQESEVYIIPYDENIGWGKYSYKRVETDKHRVTTQIERMTRYSVLAPIKTSSPQPTKQPTSPPDLASIPLEQALSSGLPTLAEFGRGICVPCKAMKPILEELATEYEGKLNVVIVEIDDHMDQTREYGIMAIPTQIFFDGSGQEITRHVGFYAKDEIIAQLKKMGIE